MIKYNYAIETGVTTKMILTLKRLENKLRHTNAAQYIYKLNFGMEKNNLKHNTMILVYDASSSYRIEDG